MPAWLIAVLRVIGIRRAADVVPVATRVGEAIAPGDPGQPLSHKDVETLVIKAAPPRPPRKPPTKGK